MISSRQAAIAAASLLSALILVPTATFADDKSPQGDASSQKDHNKKGGRGRDGGEQQAPREEKHRGGNPQGMRPQGGAFGQQPRPQRNQGFGNNPQPNRPALAPGNNNRNNSPAFTQQPPRPPVAKPPVINATPKTPIAPPNTLSKERTQNQFNAGDRRRDQKHLGDQAPGLRPGSRPANRPVLAPGNVPGSAPGANNRPAFAKPTNVPPSSFGAASPNRATNLPRPPSAADARKRFDNLRKARTEKTISGGGVVINEPGNRTIIKQNNRFVIQHDETERLRRVAPNARFEKGKSGTNIAVIDRPGNMKIYSETDASGNLIRRYRRGPDGRDVMIIDNRRRRHGGSGIGRNIAAGVGIGIGVVAGAALLNSVLDVPPPRVRIPRDQYIVEYEGASDEDVYDALSAPPVDDFSDRYTLDEIRATATLRDRMRRIDLDDINFEFGSWEVDPSEYGKLERVARAMQRVISRNPNEVFMIEGYTDAVGSPEDNLSLSDRRAESVAEVLTEEFQVPFENLVTQGYGEDYLKVPTQQAERVNRRVAVRRITPLLARGDEPPGRAVPPPGSRNDRYDSGPGPDDGGPGPDDSGPGPGGPDAD